MSVPIKYASINSNKDLSNIDDLLESFDSSIISAIDQVIKFRDIQNKAGRSLISLWSVNGPLLADESCVNDNDCEVHAHKYYLCVGCKIMKQLEFTIPNKSYIIQFGNMEGYKVYLKQDLNIAPTISIKNNGKLLGKNIDAKIGSCGLVNIPNLMVGLDGFTNNIITSYILSEKIKYATPIHFAYVCNNMGYIMHDKYHNLDKYITKYPQYAKEIFQQLISFYKDCRNHKYNFTHGNPSLDCLMVDDIDGDPLLKIGKFNNSSITYNKDKDHVRFHHLGSIPAMMKLSSIIKFNKDNNSYKFSHNNKYVIKQVYNMGIPLFNESYDIYNFILILSKLKAFNNYFIESGIYEEIFTSGDTSVFLSSYKQTSVKNPLIGLNLYCNVLDRI